jgi:hypothetical protein
MYNKLKDNNILSNELMIDLDTKFTKWYQKIINQRRSRILLLTHLMVVSVWVIKILTLCVGGG